MSAEINNLYKTKDVVYFESVRKDILPLLPQKMNRILEVGCGSGNTLNYIKNNCQCDWVCGVEFFHDAAESASSKVDLLIEGDIEKLYLPIDPETLDVILCLDVLEHLVDPWEVISKLSKLLKPDGIIIASIPNIRNFHVVLPLIFGGKWEYTDEGLLDRTHLRFFTKKTALNLLESSGLKVDKIKETGFEKGSKTRVANLITFSLFKPFFTTQYLLRAKKYQRMK
jgi:2-polyprenyl-3-methyl-5-hydroxy-6-metoxy-1,4-benzoquinol methylase